MIIDTEQLAKVILKSYPGSDEIVDFNAVKTMEQLRKAVDEEGFGDSLLRAIVIEIYEGAEADSGYDIDDAIRVMRRYASDLNKVINGLVDLWADNIKSKT